MQQSSAESSVYRLTSNYRPAGRRRGRGRPTPTAAHRAATASVYCRHRGRRRVHQHRGFQWAWLTRVPWATDDRDSVTVSADTPAMKFKAHAVMVDSRTGRTALDRASAVECSAPSRDERATTERAQALPTCPGPGPRLRHDPARAGCTRPGGTTAQAVRSVSPAPSRTRPAGSRW